MEANNIYIYNELNASSLQAREVTEQKVIKYNVYTRPTPLQYN